MRPPDPVAVPRLEDLSAAQVESLADIGGTSVALMMAALARWEAVALLVDLCPDGRWGGGLSPWVAPYRDRLLAEGVVPDRIRVLGSAAELCRADVVYSLGGFGDAWKIKHMAPVLDVMLHADSRLLVDLKKGSGGYPFLKTHGACDTLHVGSRNGTEVARVRLSPHPPPEVSGHDAAWSAIAQGLAGPQGFFRENGMHSFLFMPRSDTLVVTFDNLDIAMGKRDARRPWGFEFIERQGWSMLGVMANGWTWYRDPWVAAEFDRLAAEGFFARFARVVFYGASMGGYAAAAFSAACPGADVVAISPQSTLDKSLVPWETRYHTAWDKDFTGRYGDAAEASRAAARVILLHDPYEPLDAGHARRFTAPNVLALRTPLLGHRLGSSLNQMGILSPVILAALDGTLDATAFYRLLRARREFPRYQRELFQRARDHGHLRLARQVASWVLARGENRPIRQALKDLPKQ